MSEYKLRAKSSVYRRVGKPLYVGLLVVGLGIGAGCGNNKDQVTVDSPARTAGSKPPEQTTPPPVKLPSEELTPVEIAPVEGPVSADRLWLAHLTIRDCALENGGVFSGPVPTADGTHIDYALGAANTEKLNQIDKVCTPPLVPLAMQFALDASSEEAAALREIRGTIADCLSRQGIAIEVEAGAEDPLRLASNDHPQVFEGCLPLNS